MSTRRLIVASCLAAVALSACHRPASGEDHTSHMAGSAPGAVSGQGVVGLPASNGAPVARIAARCRNRPPNDDTA
jgi:hypothetical protein